MAGSSSHRVKYHHFQNVAHAPYTSVYTFIYIYRYMCVHLGVYTSILWAKIYMKKKLHHRDELENFENHKCKLFENDVGICLCASIYLNLCVCASEFRCNAETTWTERKKNRCSGFLRMHTHVNICIYSEHFFFCFSVFLSCELARMHM